jgi:hypothetical protein
MSAGPAAFFLVREVEPDRSLALAGTILHALPYLLVRALTRRFSTERDHWRPTPSSSTVVPIAMIAEIVAAWRLPAWPWPRQRSFRTPASCAPVPRLSGNLPPQPDVLRFLFSPRLHAKLERGGAHHRSQRVRGGRAASPAP